MRRETGIEVRADAVGLPEAGWTQKAVADKFGVTTRAVRKWLVKRRSGESLCNRPGRGRKQKLDRVSKIVIGKSLQKRGYSTRKLARKLTANGRPVSKRYTVHKYLRETIHVIPYKPQLQPRLTDQQKKNRLLFCKERRHWKAADWKKVLFSDESPFELFHPPNRQNDRVWAKDRSNLPIHETVKHPAKIQVWAVMSHRALSELHFIPPKTSINSQYYTDEILTKSLSKAMSRTASMGSTLKVSLLEKMSEAIFQQDGAPAHNSKMAQDWCTNNLPCLPSFWRKGTWPGNSPDLSPIENLWATLQKELDSLEPATSLKRLEAQLKSAWKKISPETLENLYNCMPNRIKKCIRLKGGYINK